MPIINSLKAYFIISSLFILYAIIIYNNVSKIYYFNVKKAFK